MWMWLNLFVSFASLKLAPAFRSSFSHSFNMLVFPLLCFVVFEAFNLCTVFFSSSLYLLFTLCWFGFFFFCPDSLRHFQILVPIVFFFFYLFSSLPLFCFLNFGWQNTHTFILFAALVRFFLLHFCPTQWDSRFLFHICNILSLYFSIFSPAALRSHHCTIAALSLSLTLYPSLSLP